MKLIKEDTVSKKTRFMEFNLCSFSTVQDICITQTTLSNGFKPLTWFCIRSHNFFKIFENLSLWNLNQQRQWIRHMHYGDWLQTLSLGESYLRINLVQTEILEDQTWEFVPIVIISKKIKCTDARTRDSISTSVTHWTLNHTNVKFDGIYPWCWCYTTHCIPRRTCPIKTRQKICKIVTAFVASCVAVTNQVL